MQLSAQTPASSTSAPRIDASAPGTFWVPMLSMAVAMAALHMATNGRYGFHRDELQFLSDARHLDWGFVAYPPLTPFLEHIGLAIFGLSLTGLRLFSVIAQAVGDRGGRPDGA